MRQAALATVLRWAFIGSCLAAYWAAVGWLIADARAHMWDVFAWLGCGVVTLPWSAVVFVFEPAEEQRAWLTAITASGALLSGLLFALVVRWLTRGPRPPAEP